MGLSDRVPDDRLPSLEVRMDDARAVMDAVGSERAVVMGVSEGGPMATLFAATYPERTIALVLFGTSACWRPTTDYPWPVPTDEQLRARRRGDGTDVGHAGVRGARIARLGRADARERRPRDRLARGLPAPRRQSRSRDRARADEPRDRCAPGVAGDPRPDARARPRRRPGLHRRGVEVDGGSDPRRALRLVPRRRPLLLGQGTRTSCSTRSSGSWRRSATRRPTSTACSRP